MRVREPAIPSTAWTGTSVLTAAATLVVLVIVEVAVFVQVARTIGGAWAVLLLIAGSVAGVLLSRLEILRGWRRLRVATDEGRPPGADASTSMVGVVGALLLAAPGFFTAALGLVLLLPPSRQLIRRAVERAADPEDAADLFGPRRVRVRAGESRYPTPSAQIAEIEGEIVRRRHDRVPANPGV